MNVRFLAPAGAPIRVSDLLRWTARWRRLDESAQELQEAISSRLRRKYCLLTSTGRTGLTLLLRALASLVPGRSEVVLPSYTCYSVAASVIRAGLVPRIVDLEPRSLDFDLEKLGNSDLRRAVAVITTNLYGLPGSLQHTAEIAKARNVFLVDDAAQSLGAEVQGRPSGSWGDAGLLSFDKGKPISAIEGGAILTDSSDIAAAVQTQLRDLPGVPLSQSAVDGLKLAAYVTLLHPRLYWLPNGIPWLGLGSTELRVNFQLHRRSPFLTALAATMWHRLDEFVSDRRANAALYRAGLDSLLHLRAVRPVQDSQPSYLRFPILLSSSSLRSAALLALRKAGIGATGSYPNALPDVAALRGAWVGDSDVPGGRLAASTVLTLPTHSLTTTRDIERAVELLSLVGPSDRNES